MIDLMEFDPKWRLLEYVSNPKLVFISFSKEYFIG